MNTLGILGHIKSLKREERKLKILLTPLNVANSTIEVVAKGSMADTCEKELEPGALCVVQCEIEANEEKGHDFVLTKVAMLKKD